MPLQFQAVACTVAWVQQPHENLARSPSPLHWHNLEAWYRHNPKQISMISHRHICQIVGIRIKIRTLMPFFCFKKVSWTWLRIPCTCKLVKIPDRISSCKQDLNISYRAWRVGGPTYALISARSTKAISAIKVINLYDLQHVKMKSCASNGNLCRKWMLKKTILARHNWSDVHT